MEADVPDKNTGDVIKQNLDSIDEDLDLSFTLGNEKRDLLNQLQREERFADKCHLFLTTLRIMLEIEY